MPRVSAASVKHKGKLLERKETDAKRQQDMPQRKVCRKRNVDIFNEEISIFEITEYPQIKNTAQNPYQLSMPRK